ncbi:hypothetical protein [Streptomyces sp. TLI_171]|uniref:hypothetical protein n=1 Tax=Streptomyces sp. TLI_171 TaxID=1938859 RepID=UPI000C1916AA|nr:hypothetical protein [Streptomyces sp. TLI_171]RKE23603.1 hypothetical protein BX266_7088 [Streptomyces sp. TLI_171]
MTSQSAATLRSRYAVQAASDLEENRRRQQELAEQMKVLRGEEALLIDIIALAEHYPADTEDSPLPEQAQDEPAPAPPAAPGKPRRPLLGDVLTELLAGHREPCLAKDLRDELVLKHPDREPTPQVVRNTLESLVAKGRVNRHKEDRSVRYTLTDRGRRKAR